MRPDEHIPVTEETRQELSELQEPGQTYDDLLQELARLRRRRDLEKRLQELDAAAGEALTSLDDV